MIAGFFILLRISLKDFTKGIFNTLIERPKGLKDEISEASGRKKKIWLKREIFEVQEILQMTDRANKFPMVCAVSLMLFAAGATIAIVLGNFILLPIMACGMALVPFWYIKLTKTYYKKDIAAELETALSIITTAYLRTEDIQTAVSENIEYLNMPVRAVFQGFLTRIRLIDPDVVAALQDVRTKMDNDVFREWCDSLIDCQFDRSLKSTLTPTVSKLSDMRIVNGELENMLSEPRKEFIIMQILVIGNIPLMYFLNRDWYYTLMHTIVGQAILAVCAAVVFISTAFVIKLTKPIEFRR